MYRGNSYRLMKVKGPGSVSVLCLIQVLTLVVCSGTAGDSGHAGRDKWQLEVTLCACAGVVQVAVITSLKEAM